MSIQSGPFHLSYKRVESRCLSTELTTKFQSLTCLQHNSTRQEMDEISEKRLLKLANTMTTPLALRKKLDRPPIRMVGARPCARPALGIALDPPAGHIQCTRTERKRKSETTGEKFAIESNGQGDSRPRADVAERRVVNPSAECWVSGESPVAGNGGVTVPWVYRAARNRCSGLKE